LSATSTTAAWSPAVGTSAGDTDATVVPAVAAAVAAVSSCCDPVATAVSRGGTPFAAAHVAVRSALAEHRLVVVGVPDLSAFAGTRAGTIGVTLSTRKRKG
jgi:hypothetical protein